MIVIIIIIIRYIIIETNCTSLNLKYQDVVSKHLALVIYYTLLNRIISSEKTLRWPAVPRENRAPRGKGLFRSRMYVVKSSTCIGLSSYLSSSIFLSFSRISVLFAHLYYE